MAMICELRFFEALAADIGAGPALQLCAFFSGRSCYVPEEFRPDHTFCKLLGEHAFLKLIATRGGETLNPPALDLKPLRNAGKVLLLSRHKLPVRTVANIVGLTPRRISQLIDEFRREGMTEFSALIDGAYQDFQSSPEVEP